MNPKSPRVLIVDDEAEICFLLARLMIENKFEVETAQDGPTALQLILSASPDVMLLDLRLPDMDGKEILRAAKDIDPDLPIIVITGYADVSGAVEMMRAGAHDYLAKPFDHNEVVRVVHRAVAERHLKTKLKNLSSRVNETSSLSKMMGSSNAVRQLITEVNRVACSNFTVIISGETGCGKELVAQAIHYASNLSAEPFIAIDCGALPPTLLESELFGHEKGAFTGAVTQKRGKFEEAGNGTILLDEISNMPFDAQAKLLRLLQEKKGYRVGGTETFTMDARLLVASNQNLETAVSEGNFRSDLFYRLNEYIIKIPSLRKRKEDIPYLANRFMKNTSDELGKNVAGISPSAMEILISYDWPGNVRQLRSTIRRAVLLANEIITERELKQLETPISGIDVHPANSHDFPWGDCSLKEIVKKSTNEVEKEILQQTLKHTGGNKAKAARILRIDYKTIHTKIKLFGIPKNGGTYDKR